MPSAETANTLEDLPPSTKVVYTVLAENGSLTQQEIAKESYLSSRTVRDATRRLEEINIVDDEINFRDARQRDYYLITSD